MALLFMLSGDVFFKTVVFLSYSIFRSRQTSSKSCKNTPIC